MSIKKSSLLKNQKRMATLNIPLNGKAAKGRSTKYLPGVDLTAMVDLAFLLITFFMLTTSLSKMSVLEVAKPVPIDVLMSYPASRTMTIVLAKNNQVVYYMGEAKGAVMNMASLSSMRKHIAKNKLMVRNIHHSDREKNMLIIIKPTANTVYRNFVDILDEINIGAIQSYAIDDKYILPKEIAFMRMKGI